MTDTGIPVKKCMMRINMKGNSRMANEPLIMIIHVETYPGITVQKGPVSYNYIGNAGMTLPVAMVQI